MADKCEHIHGDLSFCTNNSGYDDSVFCKTHIADVFGNSKASRLQAKRLNQIRKIAKNCKSRLISI